MSVEPKFVDTNVLVYLTEDLQDGQSIDGLRVVNPFRHIRGP